MDHPKDHSLFGLGLPGYPLFFETTNYMVKKTNQNGPPQVIFSDRSLDPHRRRWDVGHVTKLHLFEGSSFDHPKVVGFLRGGVQGGGNWGTLRIPREDWGTLGNIREDYPPCN